MIYIASPYSHKNDRVKELRYKQVCAFCVQKFKLGWIVFSPIAHWHSIAVEYGLPGDAETWLYYDTYMLGKADEMWILCLPGWKESKGVQAEIAFALENEITIRLFNPNTGEEVEA